MTFDAGFYQDCLGIYEARLSQDLGVPAKIFHSSLGACDNYTKTFTSPAYSSPSDH